MKTILLKESEVCLLSKCGMVQMARKVTGLSMLRLAKEVWSSMEKVCINLVFLLFELNVLCPLPS